MNRVISYIDGFNFYFGLRAKGWRRYYWLDLAAMTQSFLKPHQQFEHCHYFTARIRKTSASQDAARQTLWLDALETRPDISCHFGHYLPKPQTCRSCGATWTSHEEKMTDVNIASQLLVDAYEDKYDTAIIVSGDSDLTTPIKKVRDRFPTADLDFSGQLDDINESLNAMGPLFLLGLGLIYLILAAQFRSYFQPLLILVTVPLAFTGVTLGLVISRNPLSLYTLYGVIALTGISVNAAIVLISAANDRRLGGMRTLHATIYAARRRVVAVLMTTGTTIAGLASLAFGLGGKSLLWGPVASSIVWGLAFSSVLTLFVIPVLYRFFLQQRHPKPPKEPPPLKPRLSDSYGARFD